MNSIHCFNINNISIPYDLNTSKRIKNITIRMNVDGMKVSKPSWVKFEEVEKLLNQKSRWILKHFKNFQTIKDEKREREWKSGEKILYKGQEYPVVINTHNKIKIIIKFENSVFTVCINNALSPENKNIEIENQLKKILKDLARTEIENRLKIYSEKMGVTFKDIRVKEQKSIWGSCSRKGNLNFNWKLIMAPQWIMDYVLIHELCHLKHMNHSQKFWDMVGIYMPNYNEARQWLKNNGMKLVI